MDKMLEKGKQNHVFQLDVYFPLFQVQDKDMLDVKITSIWNRNPYLTVFITILQMILKMLIYEYFSKTHL